MPEADRKLSEAYLTAQQTVHDSLLDNFNTRDAMVAIMDVISEANIYLRTPDLKPAVLLLRSVAVYITQILKVFGVIDGADDFGFGSGSGAAGGGAANAEAASEPYIETLVSFREQVRNAALEAAKGGDAAAAIKAILATCDDLRDEVPVSYTHLTLPTILRV